MPDVKTERLLSMRAAAGYIGVSWETLRKRRVAWGIRAYIVAGHPKFRKEDLDAWLEERAA